MKWSDNRGSVLTISYNTNLISSDLHSRKVLRLKKVHIDLLINSSVGWKSITLWLAGFLWRSHCEDRLECSQLEFETLLQSPCKSVVTWFLSLYWPGSYWNHLCHIQPFWWSCWSDFWVLMAYVTTVDLPRWYRITYFLWKLASNFNSICKAFC